MSFAVSLGQIPKAQSRSQEHTLLDLHGNIPTFISITSGKVHDVNILDEIPPEAGAFYVMDRGYVDFKRLYVFTLSAASSSSARNPTFCSSAGTHAQWTRPPAFDPITP